MSTTPRTTPFRTILARAPGAVVLLLAGFIAGYLLRDQAEPSAPAQRQRAAPPVNGARGLKLLREPSHRFVRPLVECDLDRRAEQNRALDPFHAKVDARVRALVAAGKATDIALYFRELFDGLWFTVGEAGEFTPASLRKVPLMIALLKQAETTPGLLDRRVKITRGPDLVALQNIRPAHPVELGQEYALHELIRRMIVESDNNAFSLLTREVEERRLREVYGALGAGLDDSINARNVRSVAAYAGFFRVLFNGSYLSWDASDRALALLSQADFREGLVAGVPPSVPVAHKFGEHVDGDLSQLHDCGIVYYPEHPYLLCIMSRGRSFPGLLETVSSLSRLVYESVDAQHPEPAPLPSQGPR